MTLGHGPRWHCIAYKNGSGLGGIFRIFFFNRHPNWFGVFSSSLVMVSPFTFVLFLHFAHDTILHFTWVLFGLHGALEKGVTTSHMTSRGVFYPGGHHDTLRWDMGLGGQFTLEGTLWVTRGLEWCWVIGQQACH